MSDEERLRIILAVEESGRKRVAVQPGMNDADFLAGALAVMQALGLEPHRWPASWTLGLMFTGKSPLREERTSDDESPN